MYKSMIDIQIHVGLTQTVSSATLEKMSRKEYYTKTLEALRNLQQELPTAIQKYADMKQAEVAQMIKNTEDNLKLISEYDYDEDDEEESTDLVGDDDGDGVDDPRIVIDKFISNGKVFVDDHNGNTVTCDGFVILRKTNLTYVCPFYKNTIAQCLNKLVIRDGVVHLSRTSVGGILYPRKHQDIKACFEYYQGDKDNKLEYFDLETMTYTV